MPHNHRMQPVNDNHLNKRQQAFSNDPTRKPIKTVMYDDTTGYEEYEDGSIVDLPRSMRS